MSAHGKELLLEIKRSNGLPAYNGDRMRKIVNETQQLHLCIVKKMDLKTPEELRDPTVTCSIVVNNATAKRNKRMALAYVNERLNRIKRMWWTRSSILPEDMKHNMSQAEKDFFEGYDKILSAYCQDIDVDLASDMMPPRDHMVQVRILKDYGEVLLRSGQFIDLKRSSVCMLRSDVESLIQRGIAVQLKSG
ncbi:hypothetical protein AAMO2058_000823200 [Amorphochlora amoebiformis]